jgi:hypothetical protein
MCSFIFCHDLSEKYLHETNSPANVVPTDFILVFLKFFHFTPISHHGILISGFRRDVDVICGLLGNYTASCGNYLTSFRDNVSVPSSWVKIPRWNLDP